MESPTENSDLLEHDPVARKQERTDAIIAQVIAERHRGVAVPDAEVLAAHPELADELKSALALVGKIRRAYLSGMRTDSSDALPDIDRPREPESIIRPRLPGYLIAGEISRGGQATVYKAIQESTGRTVAIKVVPGGAFVASKHRTRFEREQKILAAIEHQSIVSIIDGGQTPDGSLYFVMQYIEGQSLNDYWNEILDSAEGTRKTVKLFAKIAWAVEAAHELGIIHRDLKPSNIHVDRHGEPHVLDFGLAHPSGEDESRFFG
jgi:serine/threonine protein kinase